MLPILLEVSEELPAEIVHPPACQMHGAYHVEQGKPSASVSVMEVHQHTSYSKAKLLSKVPVLEA